MSRVVQLMMLLVWLLVSPHIGAAPAVEVARDASDARWVHGKTTVSAARGAVIDRLTAIDRWPSVFRDIQSFKVVSHDGSRWVVRIERGVMNCGAHDYHVDVEPGGTVRVRIDAAGIDASVLVRVRELTATETSVTYSMFIDTRGVLGWFIPEKTLRSRQESMVRQDLTDLARAFAQQP